MRRASLAGRFEVSTAELVWRLSSHALIGASLAITKGNLPESNKQQVIAQLLCMTGIGINAAVVLAGRRHPGLSLERRPDDT
jgi:hypothetical protein